MSDSAAYADPSTGRTPSESAAAAERWCRDLPARYIGIPLTQEPVTLLLEMADAIRALTTEADDLRRRERRLTDDLLAAGRLIRRLS